MNTATPDDETTTAAGEGWSEDMELAPAHPGDRTPDDSGEDRQGERLQKVLARAGVGSRRVVENMVDEGRIAVNGRTVTVQGMRVDPHRDRIAVDGVRIEVRDDGPGIADKHRERVFERFYRADPSRSREAGGTGLGLSIVKHLVESMGGEVGVEPNAPRGSIFWLQLPRAREQVTA